MTQASVTDVQRDAFEKWARSEGYDCYRSDLGVYVWGATNSAWIGYQAALSTQPKAVSVYALKALPRYEVSNDGFTGSGAHTVERDDEYGDWIKYEDLTAIIGEGD